MVAADDRCLFAFFLCLLFCALLSSSFCFMVVSAAAPSECLLDCHGHGLCELRAGNVSTCVCDAGWELRISYLLFSVTHNVQVGVSLTNVPAFVG